MKKLNYFLISVLSCVLLFNNLVIVPVKAKDLEGTFKEVMLDSGHPVYTYTASDLYDPTPMMTPFIFIYNESGYKNLEDAKDTFVKLGLDELAEKEKALVLMMTPTNDTWGEKDVDVYKEIINQLGYIPGEKNKFVQSYSNIIYAMGEGNGADFIHNYLTKNANRIAAVLTVGGQLYDDGANIALPAYLVNANEKIIDFYKSLNNTNTTIKINNKTCYLDKEYTTKKVVVDSSDETILTKDIIDTGWNTLLRKVTRNVVIDECIWWTDAYTDEPSDAVLTLMDRILYDEEKLIYKEENTDLGRIKKYYSWIPEEALLSSNTEKYPLVITYHGSGDHAIFEAEGNGWIDIAAKERIIVVSPGVDDTSNENAAINKQFIDKICETYPVDESRIYVTGFSRGGNNTLNMMNNYPELFAAAAPIAAGHNRISLTNENNNGLDLPTFYGVGTIDCFFSEPGYIPGNTNVPSTLPDGKTALKDSVITNVLNPLFALNEIDKNIDINNLDFTAFPFTGFDTSDVNEKITTREGFTIDLNSYKSNDITMLKFAILEGADHNHYTGWAPLIWDYIKDFRRDQETGRSIYIGNVAQTVHEGDKITTTTQVTNPEQLIDADLNQYFEVGSLRIRKIQNNVFEIDEATTTVPANGPTNNCSSMYLIINENSATLIDAGNGQGEGTLNKNFKEEDMKTILEKIVGNRSLKIILTHRHIDHIGLLTNGTTVIPSDTTIYIHEDDLELLDQRVKENYKTIRTFKDSDTLNASGFNFKVVTIAGHTDGSHALIDYDKEIIFSGDAIGSGTVWLFEEDDLNKYQTSIDTLITAMKNMNNPIIYCGHRWQQSSPDAHSTGTIAIGEIGKQYVLEMQQLLKEIKAGNYKVNSEYVASSNVAMYSWDCDLNNDGIIPGIVAPQNAIDHYRQVDDNNQNSNENTEIKDDSNQKEKIKTENPQNTNSSVKTGDNIQIHSFLIMGGLSLATLTYLIIKKYRLSK
ncbi:MBL fold metallo-hydrolase [uncultured Thomasclavelia sp.]|uniref:MBL fold metallo-hydrolase n=2 Tax=Thomasclavelia TaxID=3025755 RepID=UPI00259287D9|nr:MBL fold metallo-hydrolase [uncultured Thomasclavelia sp.]